MSVGRSATFQPLNSPADIVYRRWDEAGRSGYRISITNYYAMFYRETRTVRVIVNSEVLNVLGEILITLVPLPTHTCSRESLVLNSLTSASAQGVFFSSL